MYRFVRKLRWWHASVLAGLAAAAVTFWFIYEPHDDSDMTWQFELRGSHAPGDLDRAKRILAARLATTKAAVSIAGERIVVTLPNGDDEEMFADSAFIDHQLRVPRAEIELMFLDDGSLVMEDLVERVRRDKAAAALGIVATTERRRVGSRDEVDHYLEAADQGRYVNLAWAKRTQCSDDAEAERRRVEGLGVYCMVRGAELLRAYLEGDDDLGVPPVEGFALPPQRELLFAPTAKRGWRTHFVESSLMLDPTNVVDVREGIDGLVVRLKTNATELIAARQPKPRLVAIAHGRRMLATELTQNGLQAELAIPFERADVDELRFAFDIGSLGQLVPVPRTATH